MEVFDYFCQRCFKEWPSPAKKTTLFILHLEDWEQRLERWSRLESVRKAREELFGSFPLRVQNVFLLRAIGMEEHQVFLPTVCVRQAQDVIEWKPTGVEGWVAIPGCEEGDIHHGLHKIVLGATKDEPQIAFRYWGRFLLMNDLEREFRKYREEGNYSYPKLGLFKTG